MYKYLVIAHYRIEGYRSMASCTTSYRRETKRFVSEEELERWESAPDYDDGTYFCYLTRYHVYELKETKVSEKEIERKSEKKKEKETRILAEELNKLSQI